MTDKDIKIILELFIIWNGKTEAIDVAKLDKAVEYIREFLPEEPVSEDLEEAAIMHYKDVMEYEAKTGLKPAYMTSFKAGAKWKKNQLPKWKKTINQSCWYGEIGVNPPRRQFQYEHYSINADKLFKMLEKED